MSQPTTKVNGQSTMTDSPIKTNHDLRTHLAKVWEDLRAGTIDVKEAAEFSNLAGKIINSAKLDMEYQALCSKQPKAAPILFLQSSEPAQPTVS